MQFGSMYVQDEHTAERQLLNPARISVNDNE